ncbi:hypothetical protein C8J57DRAFT_298743 [Mycena rebaudengoi]|nr:hypothetical protein C8J57DRAFT_298743 [Mycena rebaudengoi]
MVEVDICVLGEMFMRRPSYQGRRTWTSWRRSGSCAGRQTSTAGRTSTRYLAVRASACNRASSSRATSSQYSFLSVNVHVFQPSEHREGDLRPLGPPVDVQPARPHHGLDHDYFWTDPMPADPKTFVATSLSTPVYPISLPVYEASHEFDKRGRKQQQQQ